MSSKPSKWLFETIGGRHERNWNEFSVAGFIFSRSKYFSGPLKGGVRGPLLIRHWAIYYIQRAGACFFLKSVLSREDPDIHLIESPQQEVDSSHAPPPPQPVTVMTSSQQSPTSTVFLWTTETILILASALVHYPPLKKQILQKFTDFNYSWKVKSRQKCY